MATKSVSRSGSNKFDAQFTFDSEDFRLVFSAGQNAELFLRLNGPDSDNQCVADMAQAVNEFADLSHRAAVAEAEAKAKAEAKKV